MTSPSDRYATRQPAGQYPSPPARWRQAATRLAAASAIVALAACQATGPPARPVAPPPLAACTRPSRAPCYAPDPLHRAYQAGQLYARGITGKGTTIALILPDLSGGIGADLGVFDRHFRLPPARLRLIGWDHAPAEPATAPGVAGWDQEAALDLEMAHYMAPAARLLLVRIAPSRGPYETGELRTAMTALGALARPDRIDVASFSWGEYEADLTATGGSRQLATLRPGLRKAVEAGVSVIAGSGDSGPTGPDPARHGYYRFATVPWPTSDPLVTGVGGTTIDYTRSGALARPQTVWNQGTGATRGTGGGGRSAIFPRPPWQNHIAAITGDHRAVVDIAIDARAWAYIKVPGLARSPGWRDISGTSVCAPLLAGLIADAAQQAGHPLGLINPALYQMHGSADGITDITRGTNTDHGIPGFTARRGWDFPSGIGTVGSASRFVAALARLDRRS